jgi:hypothetical protein
MSVSDPASDPKKRPITDPEKTVRLVVRLQELS